MKEHGSPDNSLDETIVLFRFTINEYHTKIVKAIRVLRHGNHIIHLLSVIVMEYMSISLENMSNNMNFNFHVKCERLQIINLTFADDLFLFARGDIGSIDLMMNDFHSSCRSTGHKVNPKNCRSYFVGVTK